jgi:hypothetical protein
LPISDGSKSDCGVGAAAKRTSKAAVMVATRNNPPIPFSFMVVAF